jgi:hypothetical protein
MSKALKLSSVVKLPGATSAAPLQRQGLTYIVGIVEWSVLCTCKEAPRGSNFNRSFKVVAPKMPRHDSSTPCTYRRKPIERDFDSAWCDEHSPEIFVLPRFVARCRPNVATEGGDWVAVKAGCETSERYVCWMPPPRLFEIQLHNPLLS